MSQKDMGDDKMVIEDHNEDDVVPLLTNKSEESSTQSTESVIEQPRNEGAKQNDVNAEEKKLEEEEIYFVRLDQHYEEIHKMNEEMDKMKLLLSQKEEELRKKKNSYEAMEEVCRLYKEKYLRLNLIVHEL